MLRLSIFPSMGFALGEGEIDNSVQNLEREEEEYQRLYSRITQEESKFTAAGLEPKDEDEEDEDGIYYINIQI